MACCLVGRCAEAEDIDARLREGEPARAVARLYHLSKTAVADHRRRCLKIGETTELAQPPPRAQVPTRPDSKFSSRIKDIEAAAPVVIDVSGQVSEECPDGGEEKEGSQQSCRPNAARAMVVGNSIEESYDPEPTGTYQERVFYIADMIARGEFLGRKSCKELAARWKVSYDAVRVYARAAACVCKADRGELEQVREVAIGAWTDIRDRAREDGKWRDAAAAQAGLDRAAGVVEPTKVQFNVLMDPAVRLVLQALRDCWAELHPETLPEADERIRAVMASRR